MCTCKSNINGHLCCHEKQVKEMLGLTASHQRSIKDGSEYEKYFPQAHVTETITVPDGTVRDTVSEIENIVEKYNWQTAKISPLLKRSTLPETLDAVWTFLYTHYQYKLDRPEVEELRTPARAWHDRKTGIDCDCFSITVSSILTNLGIKHKFRITKYGAGWQHIYVIVPVPGSIKGEYWVIDCVLDRFNYEKTYTDKFDYTMETLGIPIAVLNGTEEDSDLHAILSGADFDEPGFGAIPSLEEELGAIKRHLVRTRDYIRKNPHSVIYNGGAANNLQMLNHAIHNWDHPVRRELALNGLAQAEHDMNVTLGLAGIDEYDPDEDVTLMGPEEDDLYDDVNVLGKVKGKRKFFQAVKNAHNKIVQAHKNVGKKIIEGAKKVHKKAVEVHKNVAKKVVAGAKKVGQKIVEGTKKVLKAIARYNPLSLAARGGFLLALKTNMFQLARALYPAYVSTADAKRYGYSDADIQKAFKAKEGVEKIFVKTLQGKVENLKKNIIHGATKNRKPLSGFGDSLGEPASTAVTVVAAATPLTAAAKVLSNAGLTSNGKSFIQVIADFFRKHKEKIKNAVKKIGTKIKNRKNKGEGSEGGEGVDSQESESTESGSEENIVEAGVEDNTTQEQRDAEKAAYSASQASSSGDSEDTDDYGSDEKTAVSSIKNQSTSTSNSNAKTPSGTNSEDSFFSKVGNWVKENPGKSVAIGVVTAGAITLAVSPKARAAVSSLFGGKKKSSLSGVRRPKRKKTSKTTRKTKTHKRISTYKLK